MLRDDISRLRENYTKLSLNDTEADANAIIQFEKWFADAAQADILEYNALTLATSFQNVPDARVVLLKSFDQNGFVFFTNYNSAKGKALAVNPQGAMVFLWKKIERQVRIRGKIRKVTPDVSKAYFDSRPLESRCGAIASNQSEFIQSREDLEAKFEEIKEAHTNKEPMMPKHWGGYVLEPTEIEFWQGREGRMHDRLLYTKSDRAWEIQRLQP